MEKEWFTARELINIGELRKSEQGINKRARREKWLCRLRKGKQGTTHEYHISSLPPLTRSLLQPAAQAAEEPACYTVAPQDSRQRLLEHVERMTLDECEAVLLFLVEKGPAGLRDLIAAKSK